MKDKFYCFKINLNEWFFRLSPKIPISRASTNISIQIMELKNHNPIKIIFIKTRKKVCTNHYESPEEDDIV